MSTLRLAVLSDLHYFSAADTYDSGPSYLPIGYVDSIRSSSNPMDNLFSLIEREDIRADLVICPGDITNQADSAALAHGWSELNKLKDVLGAKYLIASTGNHEVDSRGSANFEKNTPEDHLKFLDPPYPLGCKLKRAEYFGNGYAVIEDDEYRVVSLNSCAFHHTMAEAEYNRGRIGEFSLSSLKDYIEEQEDKDTNILVCHHHPHPHTEYNLGHADTMHNGQRLLSMLESSGKRWLVIHGHKHHGKINLASGSTENIPIVFSAGSFSSKLTSDVSTVAKNQFYIINLQSDDGEPLCGFTNAWKWISGEGWIFADQKTDGIMNNSGFGARRSTADIAKEIASQCPSKSYVYWSYLEEVIPYLKFVDIGDIATTVEKLQRYHNITVEYRAGSPFQVARIQINEL